MHARWKKLAAVLILGLPAQTLWAACVSDGAGGFNCTGSSNNSSAQTGKTILDNSLGNVVLTNDIMPPGAQLYVEYMINNDYTLPNTGPVSVVRATGGIGNVTINNGGVIEMVRGYRADPQTNEITVLNPTTIAFSATADGQLLNHGVLANVDTAIYTDASTPLLTVNNGLGGVAFMLTQGNLSAGIFSNSAQVVINQLQGGRITNASYYEDAASAHNNGYWAIATYGAGKTTINNTFMIRDEVYSATIGGNVYVVDRNPLLELAQRRDPSLVLAYGPEDVGPRDSEITGQIEGDLYLGSGAHVLNGNAENIYIDQRGADVVEVTGGVANTLYTVAGDRTFTMNSNIGMGNIYINDVAESVNTINITADSYYNAINNDVITNGLGFNALNLSCSVDNCTVGGNWVGLDIVSFVGPNWTIDSTADIQVSGGDIAITSNRFRLDGSISADNITIASNTLLYGTQPAENILEPPYDNDTIGSLTGNIVNNGHIYLRNAEFTVNGDIAFNAGSQLSVRITGDGNGMVDVVGAGNRGTFNAGSILNLSVRDRYIRNGEKFTIATNSSGAPIIREDIGLLSFVSSVESGDVILTARVGIPDAFTPTVAGANAVMALMNYRGTNTALNDMAAQLQTFDVRQLERETERLHPEASNSSLRMVMGHTDRVLGLVDSHLFETHLANIKGEPRAEVDGKMPAGAGIWFQGFGSSGTQDKLGSVDGYKLSSTGMAGGIDRMIGDSDNLRLGVAGAYAYGNVDNSGFTDNNRNNITSKIGMIYGSWAPDVWYLNGAMGVALHGYETERVALGYSNDSHHSSLQYTAKADAGWPLVYNDLLTFVPQISLNYSRINEEGYRETGSQKISEGTPIGGVLSETTVISPTLLSIEGKRYDSIRTGLGGKILLSLQEADYNAGLELRAHYVREHGDLSNNSHARFIAGNLPFYSPGQKADRDAILFGSSVRLTGNDDNDQLTLLASYDAELREKYFGQYFSLMVRYDLDQGPSYIKKAEFRRMAALERKQAAIDVKATEQDIAALSAAMQPNLATQMLDEELKSNDENVREQAQKQKAVSAAIDAWLNALINNNVQSYLGSYSADFVNDEGSSRRQWEQKRRKEMKEGGRPRIRVSDLQIKTQGKQAATVFTQTQLKGSQLETMQKIVELEERNGRWLIVSEDSVPLH